jgi:Secretion system C-terminal sorting domain
MKKNSFLLCIFCICCTMFAHAQNSQKRALFIGNSYTYYNNLPLLTAQIATNMSDTLVFDSNTPGGYKFSDHNADATSIAKIADGNAGQRWDYVVLQEQSQLPAFPDAQVQAQCFPFAQALNTRIKNANLATKTVFYMTWGRKNGDASNCANFPPMCTYNGMDSLLRLRYMTMANDNEAQVSPVGAVWRHIRTNFSTIELYQSDLSHPSLAGSYAAACTFYTVFFQKNPELISFNGGLSATDAANIRSSVKTVVFDNLATWNITNINPTLPNKANANGIDWIKMFPNPARDTVFIEYADAIQSIEMVDVSGKTFVAPFDATTKSINITQLPQGVYFVLINKTDFAKFVKQ